MLEKLCLECRGFCVVAFLGLNSVLGFLFIDEATDDVRRCELVNW